MRSPIVLKSLILLSQRRPRREWKCNQAFAAYKMAAVCSSLAIFSLFWSFSLAVKDVFHEELLLRPLKTGHVYAHFQFTTVWDVDIRDTKSCKCHNFLSAKITYSCS